LLLCCAKAGCAPVLTTTIHKKSLHPANYEIAGEAITTCIICKTLLGSKAAPRGSKDSTVQRPIKVAFEGRDSK